MQKIIEGADIINYTVKGFFLNHRSLCYHVSERTDSKSCNEIPAYQKPVLEYYLIDGELQKKDISFEDLHILGDLDDNQRLDYVLDIVNKEVSSEALQRVEESRYRFYDNSISVINNNELIENEFLVPSSTNNNYSIHQISHKGSSLLKLTQEGYPVPDFCILTANNYHLSREKRNENVHLAIKNLEQLTGQQLGSIHSPLVFAMRCATSKYIPGLMPTYLNVGLTQDTFLALKELYGYHVASKIYLNNLQTIYQLLHPQKDPPIFTDKVSEYSFRDVYRRIQFYYDKIEKIDRKILTDPYYQIVFLIDEVFRFYEKHTDLLHSLFIRDKSYPSFILQKMVWTVRDRNSCPGVLYSVHSRTGIGYQIESYPEIFGEDIMTGAIEANDIGFNSAEDIRTLFPSVHHFFPALNDLEKELQSPVTIEFAAETNKQVNYFALLQLNASELTGRATLLSAIKLYRKGMITKDRVLSLVHPYHRRQIFSESIDDSSLEKLEFFSSGVSVLPRLAVSCKVYFSAEKALEAKKKGEQVCLCKEQFVPADTIVMSEIDAILSLNPAAIHVVTACLSYGVPAFLNLEDYHIKLENSQLINQAGMTIKEGDWITISSKYQKIYLGRAHYIPARFERYLKGEKLMLSESDQEMFRLMADAYHTYDNILKSIASSDIKNLSDLIKVIRTDLQSEPVKAGKFMNSWFDSNKNYYIRKVLDSSLGMHRDQHELYTHLSDDRKIQFFKKATELCIIGKKAGYQAGAFMLGRFLSLQHPVSFWKAFYSTEIIYMLNEMILFEKYTMLLHTVGERNVLKAKNTILTEALPELNLHVGMIKHLVTLKLSQPDWSNLQSLKIELADPQLGKYLELLTMPFGEFFDYEKEWSVGKLKKLCLEESLAIPQASQV